jgi:hypothetical protein
MREAAKLVRLDEVEVRDLKSGPGRYLRLRFGRRWVVTPNVAHPRVDEELYAYWRSQIGTYRWIRGGWRMGPDQREYRVYSMVEGS